MVTFNLYPWRALLYAYQWRVLKKMLTCSFLSSVITILFMYGALLHQEEHARSQLVVIKRELKRYAAVQARIDAKISRAMPVGTLKQLFTQQTATREFFAGMGLAYDEDVCFTKIARNKNKIMFSGHTRSALDLREFFRSWRAAHLFSDIYIDKLEQRNGSGMQFRFEAAENAI